MTSNRDREGLSRPLAIALSLGLLASLTPSRCSYSNEPMREREEPREPTEPSQPMPPINDPLNEPQYGFIRDRYIA